MPRYAKDSVELVSPATGCKTCNGRAWKIVYPNDGSRRTYIIRCMTCCTEVYTSNPVGAERAAATVARSLKSQDTFLEEVISEIEWTDREDPEQNVNALTILDRWTC